MPKEKAEGFPVFKSYGWSGNPVDAVLAEMPSTSDRATYLERKEVALALAQARLSPTSKILSERFSIDDRPSLFVEFANAGDSADAILEFVSRNGLLDETAGKGESAFDFLRECETIRGALMWVWHLRHDWSQPTGIENIKLPSEAMRRQIAADSAAFLRELVNKRLAACTPSLDSRLRLTCQPKRLVDAIWMQLAKAIDGGRKVEACLRCRKFFEVAGGASRSDRAYCGNTCKVAAYRARKQQATELRSQGLAVREIAKQLRSDVETVKGWIEEKGE